MTTNSKETAWTLESGRPGPWLRATSPWVGDEGGTGPLPPGEWWVTDPAEGNINHTHGLEEWGVTATSVRDNVAIVTVIHQPLRQRTS